MHEVLAAVGSEIILVIFLQSDFLIADSMFQKKVRRKNNCLGN